MDGIVWFYVGVALLVSASCRDSGQSEGDASRVANLLRDRGIALATSEPEKAAAYLAEAYRLSPSDHIVQFWLPAVLDSITPTRIVGGDGACVVAASASGDMIALRDDIGTIRTRDLVTGKTSASISPADPDSIVSVNSAPPRLVIGGSDSLEVWDLDEHRLQDKWTIPATPDSVLISREGTHLAVQGLGWAMVLASGSGEPGLRFGLGPPDLRVQMSSDGQFAAIMSFLGTTVYNVEQAVALYTATLGGATMRSITFHPAQNLAVAADSFGIARLLNLSSGQTLKEFGQVGTGLSDAVLSEGHEWLATANRDGVVRVWEVETGRHLAEFVGPRASAVVTSSFVAGHLFAVWNNMGPEQSRLGVLWDFLSGRVLASWDASEWLNVVVVGQRAINLENCNAELWDLIPRRLRYNARVEGQTTHIEYDASDGWVKVGDETRTAIFKPGEHRTAVPLDVSYAAALFGSPLEDVGSRSASLGAVQLSRMYGMDRNPFPHCPVLSADQEPDCPSGPIVSPDQRTLFTCGEIPRFWDVETGAFLGELSQTERLSAVAFSKGGDYLATVTASGVLQLWTVALEVRSVGEVLNHASTHSRWEVVGQRLRLREER